MCSLAIREWTSSFRPYCRNEYSCRYFARYNRLIGNNVAMVSGSDMHGTPVTLLANDLGVTPEEISKKYHDIWSKSLKEMNFQYDLYTHTYRKSYENS